MSNQLQMLSFHIIQRKSNGFTLISWTYPTITRENRNALLQRAFLYADCNFVCFRTNDWIYTHKCNDIPNAKECSVALITKEFNPIKYKPIVEMLSKKLEQSNNPVELVKLYLNIFLNHTNQNGTNLKQPKMQTNIKSFIKSFGPEVILIYTALLLKKRVLVYDDDVDRLQETIYWLTKLVSNRDPNDYLFPVVETIPDDVRKKAFFVAGIRKSSKIKSSSFDLYVDSTTNNITISPHAKEYFGMTKTHKEIALFLNQLADNTELTDDKMISAISDKTEELLKQLQSLATTKISDNIHMITMEDLRMKNFNQTLENFLFNLAAAENIMMV